MIKRILSFFRRRPPARTYMNGYLVGDYSPESDTVTGREA